ncbi:hypothetical protein AJ878_00050, partial [Campylobacter jejuni]|uniref:DUF4422 domain-containing protein n=1 Tax=Campylobacter jejuni TaxID=197 RepID=UPI0008747599
KTTKVKILVGYHKPAVLLKDDILTPIHLGRVLATQASKDGEMSKEDFEWMCENMIGDDTGDNISHLNRYFCELTGIYWAWKNYDKLGNPDYIGFMHYRRHFIFDENIELPTIQGLENYFYYFDNINQAYLNIINILNIENIKAFDMFIPEPYHLTKNKLKTITIENDFSCYCENVDILYYLENLLQCNLDFQEYKEISELFYTNTFYYFCNMFVMKKEIFFEYCEFLFKLIFLLFKTFKDRFTESKDPTQVRTLSFIAEHITTFFILKQYKDMKNIKQLKIGFIENTINQKLKLDIVSISLKQEILKHSIISFDLFDTLLIRTFAKPEDVFEYLEQYYHAPNFKKERIGAEKKLRNNLGYHPSYDDIYNCIDKKFYFLKELERKLEQKTIYINPLIKEILNYAKFLNKKIIFVTDMYFDDEFFIEILQKNDINHYDKIYISGQLKKSKEVGDLFDFINKELQANQGDILHIGDNYVVDFENSKKYGWSAFYLDKPLNHFFADNLMAQNFLYRNPNLTSSIIVGVLLRHWVNNTARNEDYWSTIGYNYGGPINYALSKFVYDEAIQEKLEEFIFIARDGYVINQIFNLLQTHNSTNIKTHYIRAPRVIRLLTKLDTDPNFSWDKAGSIIRLFQKDIENFQNINLSKLSYLQKVNLIKSNYNKLSTLSELKLSYYLHYFKNFNIKRDKIGFFDISANSFTSMKILKDCLPNSTQLIGYYWNVLTDAYKNIYSYKAFNSLNHFLDHYMISELLVTSSELPVKNISSLGFEFIDNKLEKQRSNVSTKIIPSEIQFSKDLLNIFGEFNVVLDNLTLIDYINMFTNNLTYNDRYFLENLYQACNEDHTQYIKFNFTKNNVANDHLANPINIGAVFKIKSHLSYKVGSVLVKSKRFTDFIKLPIILISIIIAHKSQKNNHNFLPIEEYADYEEALKVKQHLSYLLGNALIKNPFKFIFIFPKIIQDFKSKNKE